MLHKSCPQRGYSSRTQEEHQKLQMRRTVLFSNWLRSQQLDSILDSSVLLIHPIQGHSGNPGIFSLDNNNLVVLGGALSVC